MMQTGEIQSQSSQAYDANYTRLESQTTSFLPPIVAMQMKLTTFCRWNGKLSRLFLMVPWPAVKSAHKTDVLPASVKNSCRVPVMKMTTRMTVVTNYDDSNDGEDDDDDAADDDKDDDDENNDDDDDDADGWRMMVMTRMTTMTKMSW